MEEMRRGEEAGVREIKGEVERIRRGGWVRVRKKRRIRGSKRRSTRGG